MKARIAMESNKSVYEIVDLKRLNEIMDDYGTEDLSLQENNGELVVYGLDAYLQNTQIRADKKFLKMKQLLEELEEKYNTTSDDIWEEICNE